MIRRPLTLPAILAVVALCAVSGPGCSAVKTAWQKASNRTMVHRIAPALTGSQWIHPAAGPATVTSSYEGHYTLLVFFDPREPRTAELLPVVADTQKRYRADGVVVLGVTEADHERTTFFLEKHPMSFSVLADAHEDRIAFGIKNLYEPVVYLVDPYRRILTDGLDPALALLAEKHGH